MNIVFKNLSKDVDATITIGTDVITVAKLGDTTIECEQNSIVLSVVYNRDFTFGIRFDNKLQNATDKVASWSTQKVAESISKAILQLKNTYKISNLSDGMVIEVNDKAHYVDVPPMKAFFGCFPALYYFGAVECHSAKIEVVSSVASNRDEFINFYKWLFRLTNWTFIFFNVLKYKMQINYHCQISTTQHLTTTFKGLYSLSKQDREYQFKPLKVVSDKVFGIIKEKIPEAVFKKIFSRKKNKKPQR